MNKKSEALRLADALDSAPYSSPLTNDAAEELRRLYAVNEELLKALKAFLEDGQDYTSTRDKARAAIAKAGGEA